MIMSEEEGIFISIKPHFVDLILNKRKNYEFRKYIPKKEFKRIYIYETLPKARIKYVIEILKIYIYPQKIDIYGVGNEDFNNGNKKSKFAYKLGKIYQLEDEINLKDLKIKYGFVPPQNFSYTSKYKKLTEYINNNLKEM